MTAPALDDLTQLVRRGVAKARHVVRSASTGAPAPASVTSARWLQPIPPASGRAGPTVVLLNDCRDQVNFGANVLVDGLVRIVQDALPDAVIQPIPSHWLMDTSGGFEAFVDGGADMARPAAVFPQVADEFESVADEWLAGAGGRDAGDFLHRLEGADVVILNGEGSIYRTNQSAIRELFLAWLAKVRLGIPTVFLNGMVHLTDVVPILPPMVRLCFGALDAVAVREPCSLRNLRAFAPEIDARVYPDSAFVCGPDEARETPAVRAVRSRIGAAPYFCFDPGPMPMDASRPGRSALHQLVTRLQQVAPRAVLVNSAPSDGFIEQVAADTGALYVDTIADYREFMALVGDAQFLVSGRYHNPILAAIMGCPSITFASANHKVHGACETLDGLIGSPYDGTHLLPVLDDIEERARRYVAERDGLRDALQSTCDRHRVTVYELGAIAGAALRSTSGVAG